MSRSKPSACFEMQCPLAVNCTCGHHLDLHPEEGHCSHVDSPKEEGGVGKLCECPSFRSKGAGFVLGVGDPQTAKVAIILEAPGKEELGFQIEGVGAPGIIHPKEAEFRKRDYPEIAEKEPRFLNWGAPIVGKSGSLVNSWLLPKAGLRRTEIFVDNSIRCLVDKNKKGEMYPTGVERHQAEACCRRYDRIQQMRPDAVLVSIHPASILREVTPLPLVIKDVEKAASFSRQGLKTLLLMGGKAADVFLGYGTNVTRWRGHYEIVRDKVGGWYESVLERVKGKLKKGKGKAAKKKGKGAVIDAAVDGESMVQEVPVKKVRKSRKKKENSDLQTTLSTS